MLTEDRIAEIANRLACPKCKCGLERRDDTFSCIQCGNEYPIRNGQIYFCEPAAETEHLDLIKGYFKRHLGQVYYSVLKPIIAPGFPFRFRSYVLKAIDPEREFVVDLGSGNQKISDEVLSLDFMDFDEIDIVADMGALPFLPGSVDVFISNGVLEHVADIGTVAREIAQATKDGGRGIHHIPFMYPFHASPYDFQRFTSEGAKLLFGSWELKEQFASTGPFTLFNVVFLELMSILLSFGNRSLKGLVYIALCPVVFPIKFLDVFFYRRPSILSLAPTIVTHLRKPVAVDNTAVS